MAEPYIKKDAITQMEIKLLETFKICPQEIFPSVTNVKKNYCPTEISVR
jgi:hypothetical protein